MYDLIIAGGGPAGIGAAIYAARQKNKTLLITRDFGEQWAKKEVQIENYPGLGKISGFELAAKFRDQLASFSVEVMIGEVARILKAESGFSVITEKESCSARAVIVATGAAPRLLDIAGEKEFAGRGVCYCATCDGPLFANRDVAVVGGGAAAWEAAVFFGKVRAQSFCH